MNNTRFFLIGMLSSAVILGVIFYLYPYRKLTKANETSTLLMHRIDGYKVRLSEVEKTSYSNWSRMTTLQDSVEILDNSLSAQNELISQLQYEKNAFSKFDYHRFTDSELSSFLSERYTKEDSLR
jgi:hypothetical protein